MFSYDMILTYHCNNFSAPVGPTQCEYCGNRNTDDCKSNLPDEYALFMKNGRDDVKDDNSSNAVNQNVCCDTDNATEHNTQASDKDTTSSKPKENICPRPQLFFLKKKPPFATPEGWDPVTEYRINLFEAPSSVEGMGRGWGEVRGHLGNNTTGESGGGGLNSSMNSRKYTASACGGSSVCGGADGTEISFSSGGGGRRNSNDTTNNKGKANVNSSDGGRSLSPIQLLSGLMESLSPS